MYRSFAISISGHSPHGRPYYITISYRKSDFISNSRPIELMTVPSWTKRSRFSDFKIDPIESDEHVGVDGISESIFPFHLKYAKRKITPIIQSSSVTTLSFDINSINVHVHKRKVFSSTLTIEALTCSVLYLFRNNKHHNKCLGWAPDGFSAINVQIIAHTSGDTP